MFAISRQSTMSSTLFMKEFTRSYLVEQDWTQRPKREGTFVLDSPDSSSSRPSSARNSNVPATSTPIMKTSFNGSLLDSRSRSASMNRIPVRKLTTPTSSHTNGVNTSSGELLDAVKQVEETISPLARANNQIRDSLAQLESQLMMLKSVSAGIQLETNNNDRYNDGH